MAVLDDSKIIIKKIEKVELKGKHHQLVPGSERVIKEF